MEEMVIQNNEPLLPYLGMSFESLEQLSCYFDKFMKYTRSYFTRRSSIRIKQHPNTTYSMLLYECKNGPKRHDSQSKGLRKSNSTKLNCGAKIKLLLVKDKLQITKLNLLHSHEDFYDNIPEVRRPSPESVEKICDLISLGCKKQQIVNKIYNEEGKHITPKDLHNLYAKRKNKNEHNLHEALQELNKNGAEVKILKEKNDFKGLYLSTPQMRTAMKSWPEIIFIDVTYKLLSNGLVTVLMLVQDSNSKTQIGCVGLLSDKNAATYQWLLQCLKSEHPTIITNVTCWMADKCKIIRKALRHEFPAVPVYICFFHTIQTFIREVTIQKMNITSADKKRSLQSLRRMVYSNTEEEYFLIYQDLQKNAPKTVIAYFEKIGMALVMNGQNFLCAQ